MQSQALFVEATLYFATVWIPYWGGWERGTASTSQRLESDSRGISLSQLTVGWKLEGRNLRYTYMSDFVPPYALCRSWVSPAGPPQLPYGVHDQGCLLLQPH